jgi:hypothetical protein
MKMGKIDLPYQMKSLNLRIHYGSITGRSNFPKNLAFQVDLFSCQSLLFLTEDIELGFHLTK